MKERLNGSARKGGRVIGRMPTGGPFGRPKSASSPAAQKAFQRATVSCKASGGSPAAAASGAMEAARLIHPAPKRRA